MPTINETYINALLADAAYVTLSDVQKQVLPEDQVNAAIAARLTQPQADFITTNFDVVNQEISPTGGFDAVVWKGRPDTDYAGKVFASMRGTQFGQDIFVTDADLAITGTARAQIVDRRFTICMPWS